ncbi:MAG: methyltransferase domain-containing protein [Vicinamibacteraceae bacterium]
MAGVRSRLSALAARLLDRIVDSAAARRNGSDPWAAHRTSRIEAKALKRFLTCLSGREVPVLLDLGPVVGANVAFFGEQLGCRIFVEDLCNDVDRFARNDAWEQLLEFLSTRFDRPGESIDGILCWDLFDHLDKRAAATLARELARLLKPGGVLLAFFGTTREPRYGCGKFVVRDDTTLLYTSPPRAAGPSPRHVLPSREIDRLFDGLQVSQSFLLRAHMRETLFRKASPADDAVAASAPIRREQPAVRRPAPAAASLKLAVGRVGAGVRRTPSTPSPGVNGVARPTHKSPLLPLKAKAKAESASNS